MTRIRTPTSSDHPQRIGWRTLAGRVAVIVSLMSTALAAPTAAGAVAGFGDVDDRAFYSTAVQWMVDERITVGVTEGCFAPDEAVTRGQAAAFLWRMEGRPFPSGHHGFDDVVEAWQQLPVAWMAERGITMGVTPTTFEPGWLLTRGELAALLWRLDGEPAGSPAHPFTDVAQPWQNGPISWMVRTGITVGVTATTFAPEAATSRGEIAAFLHRYHGSPAVSLDPSAADCDPRERTLPTAPAGAQVRFSLVDLFDRTDGPLGTPWVDCSDTDPDDFEPVAIVGGGVAIPDPETRPGTYDASPPSGHPPTGGRLHPGIGCAWTDTGTTTVSVTVEWSGNHGHADGPPISHVEATPLLYVDPSSPRYGFGAWPSEVFGQPVILLGYIGGPPERFEVVGTAAFPSEGTHSSGTPRRIELRAEEPGRVTVWMDGVQAFFVDGIGYDPVAVDPSLMDSTRHGFAVDAHLVVPRSSISELAAIEAIVIEELPGG